MKLLFYTKDYEYLADEMIRRDDAELTKVSIERDIFPDGERYFRNPHHVKGSHCIILGGTQTLDNIFEIYNLGYELATSGAKKLTLVIPYYGYQTMERRSKSGEIVMAKTMAHLLSSIPRAAYGNEVVLLELHTDTISHYFDPHVTTRAVSSTDVVMKACVELTGTTQFVLGSTDVGRAKTIEYIQRAFAEKSRDYDIETAFVYKRRDSGTDTEVTGINADVKGKIVVIYDDMIRTGGSLIKAAKIYRNEGASKVYAMTTHGVFPGDSVKKIISSGVIEKIALTNSHPDGVAAATLHPEYFRLYSVAGLLSRYV